MKTYGETRKDVTCENFTTDRSGGWSGKQSRKIALRRAADKKILHRRGRRLNKVVKGEI